MPDLMELPYQSLRKQILSCYAALFPLLYVVQYDFKCKYLLGKVKFSLETRTFKNEDYPVVILIHNVL